MLDMEAVEAFRKRGMNPDDPEAISFCESAEVYMQHRESLNTFYDKVPDMAEHYMDMIQQITGRRYHLFNYTGAPDAEYVLILMSEVRFSSLLKTFPDTAEALFEKTEEDAKERYASYVRMEFATPPFILDAIRKRLDRQILGYTKIFDPAYYEAFHHWTERMYGWSCQKEHLVTSPGVVAALYWLVGFLTKADEKVLIMPACCSSCVFSRKNSSDRPV